MREQKSPAELLVGLNVTDDAAVYLVAPDTAIVETLDFFPPIVDDAYASGAIGAANAMSDVYAMGGEVLFALNIAAWPEDAPLSQLERVFQGATDKVAEAGAVSAGGHTVLDREPKYGLAVTGRVHPEHMLLKSRRRAGDALWLTKGIGTGDRVALAVPNAPEVLSVVLGASRIGVVPVMLNASLLPAEIDALIADCGPSRVLRTLPEVAAGYRKSVPAPALASTRDWPYMGVTPDQAREGKRAYYAAISFVDAQIGRVLDALETKLPQVAAHLDRARSDVLAFTDLRRSSLLAGKETSYLAPGKPWRRKAAMQLNAASVSTEDLAQELVAGEQPQLVLAQIGGLMPFSVTLS